MDDLKDTFLQAMTGNKVALEDILNRFMPKIKHYARKLSYEEAETDIIIYMIEFIKETDPSKIQNRENGEIINFILAALLNGYKNLMCKLMNKKIEETAIDTYIIPVYDRYENLEKYDTFLLLNGLTGVQRKIITAKFVYGYNGAEIARLLGISRQAVNKQEKKAMSIIKNKLTKYTG